VAVLAVACDRGGPAPPPARGDASRAGVSPAPRADAAPRPADGALAGPGTPIAYPAVRCSECHAKMFDEWTGSAHAGAAGGELYLAMRKAARGAGCDACHAPLVGLVPPGEPVAAEGVTCEVCHNLREVEVTRAGAGFDLRPDTRIKYGPLCDAADHYFHKMGCSPLHQEAELCAGCHLYYRELPGGGSLPVFTEYEEWRDGPVKRSCQSCHMPGTRAEVATGAGERPAVSHHGWLGADGGMRTRALRATATVRERDGVLVVEVEVKNTGAGHHVPTGLPGRRVTVRAVARAGGAEQAAAEHSFARIVVDAGGTEVPFYAATRVASDDRIPPKDKRRVTLELAPSTPEELDLRVEVVWRAFDPDVARRLGVDPVEEAVLLAGGVTLGSPRAGRRPGLPRTLELAR
jgi:hypothetical protein